MHDLMTRFNSKQSLLRALSLFSIAMFIIESINAGKCNFVRCYRLQFFSFKCNGAAHSMIIVQDFISTKIRDNIVCCLAKLNL